MRSTKGDEPIAKHQPLKNRRRQKDAFTNRTTSEEENQLEPV